MPVRPIVRLGHPTLRGVAQALPPGRVGEPAIQELVDDMIDTMRAAHGVGLAAPQVGTSLQIFVYEMPLPAPTATSDPTATSAPTATPEPGAPTVEAPVTPAGGRAPESQAQAPETPAREAVREASGPIPLHVVINPMLTPQAGELVYDWEGCLSIPDLRGLVPRHPAVRVRGLDRLGQALDYVARGFEARIVQHEFDHLNGVVFLDRMRDLKGLAFRDEWERYMAAGAAEPPDPLDPHPRPSASQAVQPEEPVLASAHRGDPEVI
ncbi:MAG TPA: peptide deformylase [Thermoanaerobaculia bacterium]|nr:peptide deformylase [Thermoanaerobaculia bacterium]